jgi:hypothetical protein
MRQSLSGSDLASSQRAHEAITSSTDAARRAERLRRAAEHARVQAWITRGIATALRARSAERRGAGQDR